MILDKELYQDLIKVIDLILERKELNYFQGIVILGDVRWAKVHNWMQSNMGEALHYVNMTYMAAAKEQLMALRELCLANIEILDKEDRYRELNIKYLKTQIWYSKWSIAIAVIAIVLSIAAIIVSILAATIWNTKA